MANLDGSIASPCCNLPAAGAGCPFLPWDTIGYQARFTDLSIRVKLGVARPRAVRPPAPTPVCTAAAGPRGAAQLRRAAPRALTTAGHGRVRRQQPFLSNGHFPEILRLLVGLN